MPPSQCEALARCWLAGSSSSPFTCDAFHAMISTRPYRPALTKSEAIAELRRCAGSQFDSAVVEAFLEALRVGETQPVSV